ncbi:MAG: hypothetical protein V3T77_09460 [Planctomycetota bacterium]
MRDLDSNPRHSLARERGITLTELTASLAVIVIGLVPLACFLIPVSAQREQALQRYVVLSRAQNLMEEIKTADPTHLASTYDGKRYSFAPANPGEAAGFTLRANVDDSDPRLIIVIINARWKLGSRQETLALRTEIFNNDS